MDIVNFHLKRTTTTAVEQAILSPIDGTQHNALLILLLLTTSLVITRRTNSLKRRL